jgi:4-hydroxybenzoate polyprenyltransferase
MVLLTMFLTKYALIDSQIPSASLSNFHFVILSSSVVLISIGGYLINDVFDINTDLINKPNRVYIDQTISFRNAIYVSFFTSFTGFLLGLYLCIVNDLMYLIWFFLFCILSLFFYSYDLKKRFFLGNIVISILCSLTILLTYLFHKKSLTGSFVEEISLYTTIIGYSIFAFLTTLIREIIKDIEDVQGDLKIKATTLPIVIGRKRAAQVAFLFSCILLIFLFLILQLYRTKFLFLGYGILFILIPLLYFMSKLWMSESKKDFFKLSTLLKIIMLLGIISMLLFKIEHHLVN